MCNKGNICLFFQQVNTESSAHNQPISPTTMTMEDINEITSAYDIAQNELDLDPTVDPLSGTDISYYNTTVRTRLMLAICLEGIRCRPKEDASRCQILHAKCNEHVDTTHLSFKTRVILSECTVIDILCHLGHRSPFTVEEKIYSNLKLCLKQPHQQST